MAGRGQGCCVDLVLSSEGEWKGSGAGDGQQGSYRVHLQLHHQTGGHREGREYLFFVVISLLVSLWTRLPSGHLRSGSSR